ncbi:MAG: helix-turn-helix domain-containing protein, partial [Pseudomonas sp.]
LMPYLQRHPWPGNIRELENIVERAAVCAQALHGDDPDFSLSALFPELFEQVPVPLHEVQPVTVREDLRYHGKTAERAHVRQVVNACQGNMDEAARRLGVSRTTLWRRLREV